MCMCVVGSCVHAGMVTHCVYLGYIFTDSLITEVMLDTYMKFPSCHVVHYFVLDFCQSVQSRPTQANGRLPALQ